MTDIYGAQIITLECRGLADADDDEDLDVKLMTRQTVLDDIISGFRQWFIKSSLDIFKQSLIMSSREKLKIDGRCFSNDLELKHRLLKKKLSDISWKYNIRRNVSSEFSIATMRRVAIIFFELGVVNNFMQTF